MRLLPSKVMLPNIAPFVFVFSVQRMIMLFGWVSMYDACPLDSSGNKDNCRQNLVRYSLYVPTSHCYFKCLVSAWKVGGPCHGPPHSSRQQKLVGWLLLLSSREHIQPTIIENGHETRMP